MLKEFFLNIILKNFPVQKFILSLDYIKAFDEFQQFISKMNHT